MEIVANVTSGKLEPNRTPQDNQYKIAQEFEASFLTEMLKYTGINKTSESFGGGAGEDAFSSMLSAAYADALVDSGGIGITEIVYQSILEKSQTAGE